MGKIGPFSLTGAVGQADEEGEASQSGELPTEGIDWLK